MALLVAIEVLWFVSAFYLARAILEPRLKPRLGDQLAELQGNNPQQLATEVPLVAGLDEGFEARLVRPTLARLGRFLQAITPASTLVATRVRLDRAGNPGGLTAMPFLGIRAGFAVTGVAMAILLFRMGAVPGILNLMLAVLVAFAGLLVPDYWLQGHINTREHTIRKDLPPSIDLMVACAEAGLGLDQALTEVMRRRPGPLSDEFSRLIREVALGKTRGEAWRDLSHRVGVDELRNFASAVYQADHMGTSIAQTLRAQAEALRTRHSLWVREEAAKMPVKMMFPLIFFIFPSLFVVVLGPAAVTVLRTLVQMKQ